MSLVDRTGREIADRPDAIVVGAGPAGLATSRELVRRGVAHMVLEKGADVGTSWRNMYDSLTLHTGKHMSSLPGLRHRLGDPLFLTRDRFVAYLGRYAERFSLPVVTGREVTRARRVEGEWEVEVKLVNPTSDRGQIPSPSSPSPPITIRTPHLVLATGIMASPHRPDIPGEDGFTGRLLHSVEYRRPEPYVGRRVLVVGAGNSAGEIASELADAGVAVTLCVRSGANVLPLRLAGIPIQYLSWLVGKLPLRARERVVAAVQRLTELRRGPPVLPRPQTGLLDSIPLIGFHLVDAIRAGRIDVRGPLTELATDTAVFEDGARVPVDDVILATGFRAAVGPVGDAIELDERGFARRRERVISEDAEGLFLVGHNYDATGGLLNIRRDGPRAARAIAERTRRS